MSFSAPTLLLCLLVIPVAAAAYWWYDRGRVERTAGWGTPALLPNVATAPPPWRRHLPAALLLVGVALLLVGFARPRAHHTVKKQEATVVLVLDVSGSMAARDSFPTRLAAAKAVALHYVDLLPKGYRVGVVTFSDHTAVAVPPTHNVLQARVAIASTHTGPQGTALADAVARAVRLGNTVKGEGSTSRPPAVIVLLSDGGQTAGRVTPQQAAVGARQAGIPVTAVSLGTPDGFVVQPLRGGFTERIQVPVQPQVLELISRGSGGQFYQGAATVDFKRTFADLGSRVGTQREPIEVTAAAAGGGLAFMLVGAMLSGLWFRRFP